MLLQRCSSGSDRPNGLVGIIIGKLLLPYCCRAACCRRAGLLLLPVCVLSPRAGTGTGRPQEVPLCTALSPAVGRRGP